MYSTIQRGVNNCVAAGISSFFTADLEAKVLAKIATFSDKKITLQNIVDPSIIGGFILRMGDKQYNASVENRLQNLKREFSK